MQDYWQLCQTQGHNRCKLTHICVFQDCKETARYVYDSGKCEFNASHDHNGKMNNYIEIENFMQYFEDQNVPQIELRLKSQSGNEAKLKYLTKIYDEHFGEQLQQCSRYFASILDLIQIKQLINLYKDERVQVQLLYDTYQQLTLNGLQSLNQNKLNILINNKSELIETENQFYDSIEYFYQFDERQLNTYQEHQNYINIIRQIRTLYDYLLFQNHSTNGKRFFLNREKPMKSSFFLKK